MGPEMAVYFGCAVERATVNLKRMWDGYESYQLGLWTYYPVFSSGLSYVELGEILTRFLLNTDMHSSVLHFAAGDDTYILARDSSGIVVLEQDFSQYDASQSFVYDDDGVPRGPLANSLNFLDRLGVENHRLQNLLSSYLRRANVVFSESRLQLDFTSSCVFPTGSSMTTFNNTVNNITSFSVLLVGMTSGMVSDLREEFMAPTNAISALGFKCKVKSFSGVSEATFLKGRFSMFQYQVEGDNGSVDVRNGYLWHPDLCASLKYGKAKINPVSIYGGDFKTAFAKYLHGVAMSWDFYPKVPILRAFIKRDKKDRGFEDVQWEPDPYKPLSHSREVTILQSPDFSEMLHAYNLSLGDVDLLENLISTSPQLSVIFAGDMIERMHALYE